MKSNFFKLSSPSAKSEKRLGRGIGSGTGKTAGKGHKGQRARSGKYNLKIRGYGSQNSQVRALPKRGFKSQLKKNKFTISLSQLIEFMKVVNLKNNTLTFEDLVIFCLVSSDMEVKVIDCGIAKFEKINLIGIKVSKGVKDKIVVCGGSVN